MAWAAVAISIAVKVGSAIAGKILDESPGNEFEDALNDAMQTIELNTKEALLESTKQELRANLRSLKTALQEFMNTPGDIMKLDFAYAVATILVERLRGLDLVTPPGPGLAGHPEFLIAASLRMAVLQERIKRLPQIAAGEATNLQNFVTESVAHAETLHAEWGNWNYRRFGNLFTTVFINQAWVWYTFEGQRIPTGVVISLPSPPSVVKQKMEAAEAKRQAHIKQEYDPLYARFVDPSNKVLTEWRKLLPSPALAILKMIGVLHDNIALITRPWKPAARV